MCGTELAYGAVHCAVLYSAYATTLCCYAMSGTDLAYGATTRSEMQGELSYRCAPAILSPVLTKRVVLCDRDGQY
eukprot:3066063-Rhodomonas_salina.8